MAGKKREYKRDSDGKFASGNSSGGGKLTSTIGKVKKRKPKRTPRKRNTLTMTTLGGDITKDTVRLREKRQNRRERRRKRQRQRRKQSKKKGS